MFLQRPQCSHRLIAQVSQISCRSSKATGRAAPLAAIAASENLHGYGVHVRCLWGPLHQPSTTRTAALRRLQDCTVIRSVSMPQRWMHLWRIIESFNLKHYAAGQGRLSHHWWPPVRHAAGCQQRPIPAAISGRPCAEARGRGCGQGQPGTHVHLVDALVL